MLNVPREALRMALTGSQLRALVWIAATALPMAAAGALAFRSGRTLLRPLQWLSVGLFAGIAYGPYFLLAWNSYAYYAAVAAILPAIILARCTVGHRRIVLILALLASSSWLAVAGTRYLSPPGLLGRARWAESMLQDLARRHIRQPLWVAVRDGDRFYAAGQFGLAWRLKMPADSIHVAEQCPADASQCLQIDDDGKWHLDRAAVPGFNP
jgi:hypothetical protein